MASSNEIKHRSRRLAIQRKRKTRVLILIGAALFLAVFVGSYFALNSYVKKVKKDVICDHVFVNDLDVSGMTKSQAVQALEDQLAADKSRTVTLSLGEEDFELFLKELDFSGEDPEELAEKAVNYGKKGSLWARYRQMKRLEKNPLIIENSYSVKQKTLKEELEVEAEELLQGPENAAIERDASGEVSIVDEKDGEVIDYEETVKQLNAQLNDGWEHGDLEAEILVKAEKPEITREDLEGLTDELGSYTTYAGGGERWTNLKTGSSMLNGTLLQPGEELAVYEATAPYDEEHGYAEGTAYENGQVVPSYGGGICQVSTTLYNAVIYAELEIVERHPHSMAVDYVDPSRDAAIAGGVMDFRFKNPYDTPVYIFGEIDDNNLLRMVIYGKETRPENRTIEFESETVSQEDYGVTYQTSSELSFGQMNYTGNPHTGRQARLWKIVYEDGKEVSREIFNTSYYQKSDQIIEVGTAGGSQEAVQALENAVASNDLAAIRAVINRGANATESKTEEKTSETETTEEAEDAEEGETAE